MPARASLIAQGELTCPGWNSGPVAVARGFRQRWRGLRPYPPDCGLLIRTRSVHTVGMKVPLWIVAIDREARVISTRFLSPGRIFIALLARHVLELGTDRAPPRVGEVLTWQGAGTLDPLRHPHRQPR